MYILEYVNIQQSNDDVLEKLWSIIWTLTGRVILNFKLCWWRWFIIL